ncbi:MAG: hypothetical protein ABJC05_04100 [Pyrinomonadaceae bacterium]
MTSRTFANILASLLVTLTASYTVAVAATPVPDQPYMKAARADLNGARKELLKATSNKDGHRAKALEYVNKAISEVNAGIVFDRKHNHAISSGRLSPGAMTPDQPHMQAALNHLLDAQRNLQSATSEKGGHRVKAIEYVGKAITETNKGIAAGSN